MAETDLFLDGLPALIVLHDPEASVAGATTGERLFRRAAEQAETLEKRKKIFAALGRFQEMGDVAITADPLSDPKFLLFEGLE